MYIYIKYITYITPSLSPGESCVHVACMSGSPSVVSLVVGHSALPHLPTPGGDEAVHLAAEAGHTEVLALLLARAPHSLYNTGRAGNTVLHQGRGRISVHM